MEEKPGKGFTGLTSFGYPKDVITTGELLNNLRKNADSNVDVEILVRARLFDMLIGDWDRNEDSWNWAEFEVDGKTMYRPIPLGRNQIFPKYSGVLTYFILQLPLLYQRQTFGPELKTIRDFNWEAYPLDMALLHEATLEDWTNQAQYIQTHLTDSLIDNAF